MKNILVINGHAPYPFSEGKLNQTMFETVVETLAPHFELKTTIVNNGYIPEEEMEKFQWADAIIFQFPLYWFSFPGKLQIYIEKIYQYDVFYTYSDNYGEGGLLKGKKYMYSITCNSPKEAFSAGENSFFENKSFDELIIAMHKLQEYCGMTSMKTYCAYNAVKNPDIDEYVDEITKHIKEVFELA